jgi:hypothetical protein
MTTGPGGDHGGGGKHRFPAKILSDVVSTQAPENKQLLLVVDNQQAGFELFFIARAGDLLERGV